MSQDARLIEASLAGDRSAFGELVRKYQDRLYNALVHIIGSEEDARDVVQDAFVQAFVKLETFRGDAAFYTWLYRIAFNQSVSLRRRRRPMASLEQSREAAGEEPIDSHSPDEPMQRREQVALVRRALEALSEEHRQILVLREMEGFSYEEIAAMLEVAVGTVRSRLHRARMQLREVLNQAVREDR